MLRSRLTSPQPSAEETTVSRPSGNLSPSSGGVFFNSTSAVGVNKLESAATSPVLEEYMRTQKVAEGRVVIGLSDARREIDWLINKVPVFEKIARHFEKDEKAISDMLRGAYINQHDFRHQQTVAGYAMALSRAFNVPVEEIEAVGLAACFHDMGYTAMQGDPSAINKDDFRMHAVNGARNFEALKQHSDLEIRQYMNGIDTDAFRAAYLAIFHHNGGSREYAQHKSRIPLSSKLVRAADKAADNRVDRVFPEHLHPDLPSVDKYYRFRTVTAGIRDIALILNRETKSMSLVHDVDRTDVRKNVMPRYKGRRFMVDFNNVFNKQMVDYADVMQDAMHTPATDGEQPLVLDSVLLFENGAVGHSQFTTQGKVGRIISLSGSESKKDVR